MLLSGRCRRWQASQRLFRADEGDILLARFSLPNSSVVLSIIDDDALEELSPAV